MRFAYCILIISFVIFTIQGIPERKINFPIQKNSNYRLSTRHQIRKANQKYSKLTKRQSTGDVPLIDFYNDTLYSGIIYVGTPLKPFTVSFDTGSSDFWIGTSLCSGCTNITVYDPSSSSTYSPNGYPWNITYGDNSTSSGIMVYDTVDIGSIAITNVSLYAATFISESFNQISMDGLLGLGFDSLATVSGVKTPFQVMVDRKLVSSPLFGVYLGKSINGGNDGGECIFGGYNPSHIGGDLITIPVNNSVGFWGVDVDRIGTKKVTLSSKKTHAIVDTGTTLLLFPKNISLEISKYYGAVDNGDGTFNLTCKLDKLPPLEIELGNATFTVPSESLIFERDSDNCVAGFGYNDVDFIILGDVFIKNYYIIFNIEVPHIQIAPVK